MPPAGGRKAGVGNYTKVELEHMFASIRATIPTGGEDWDDNRSDEFDKYVGIFKS
eukprot:jgi/Psemu1/10508/gm1.10508_g